MNNEVMSSAEDLTFSIHPLSLKRVHVASQWDELELKLRKNEISLTDLGSLEKLLFIIVFMTSFLVGKTTEGKILIVPGTLHCVFRFCRFGENTIKENDIYTSTTVCVHLLVDP